MRNVMEDNVYIDGPDIQDKPKILILSPGKQVYLINRFSQYFDVILGDHSQLTIDLYPNHTGYLLPEFKSPLYPSFISDIVRDNHITYVLTLHDVEAVVLTRLKRELNILNCTIIGADANVAEICLDKYEFATYLEKCNICVPKTYPTIESLCKAIEAKEILFPIIIKLRKGMASKGVEIVNDMISLEQWKLKHEEANEYIFQEMIDGDEYGLDVVNDFNQEFFQCCAKQKLEMRNGETDAAKIVNPELFVDYAKLISKAIHHTGNIDCDIIQTSDGKNYVVDINPRFGGGYMFSLIAGMDVPYYIFSWWMNKQITPNQLRNIGYKYKKISTLCQMA